MLTDGRTDGRTHGRTDGRRTKSDHNSSSWAELRWAKNISTFGLKKKKQPCVELSLEFVSGHAGIIMGCCQERNHNTYQSVGWLQSFLFYIYFSLSLHYFFIMILFNPTSSYLWLNKNFLSSQGTEVNKNSTSYTSVVSPQKKKQKNKRPTGHGSLTWVTQSLQICRCYATFFQSCHRN